MPPRDGQAVALVRSLLQDQAVVRDVPLRSTVVSDDEGGWVVRTWTRTATSQSRPVGRPQYVHVVRLDPAAREGLRGELVWPQ